MAENTIPEGGEKITLTPEELSSVREIIKGNAEKDRQISDLTGLVGALQKQLAEGASPTDKLANEDVPQGSYCKMRKLNGKWVLGYAPNKQNGKIQAYRTMDATTREWIDWLDLVVDGEAEPKTMALLDFLQNTEQITVRIKERRKLSDVVKEGALVDKLAFSEKTGIMEPTGAKVRSKVVEERYEYVLDLDGKDVVVGERFINL